MFKRSPALYVEINFSTFHLVPSVSKNFMLFALILDQGTDRGSLI